MKMKKLFLTIVVAIVLLVAATTNVNAAEIKTANTKYEVGATVNVTVEFAATGNINLDLSYNKAFSYVGYTTDNASFGMLPPTLEDGKVKLGGMDLSNKITKVEFTFTANEPVENAEFVVDRLVAENDETPASNKVTVSVVEAQKPDQPDQPTNPTTPEQPTEPTTLEEPAKQNPTGGAAPAPAPAAPAPAAAAPADNGMPTRLPQTGVPVIAIAFVMAGVIIAIITTVKIKNR